MGEKNLFGKREERNEKTVKEKLRNKWFIYLLIVSLFAFLIVINSINLTSAAENQTSGIKYCCERTDYGAWCQNAPLEDCDSSYRTTPTSCEATSYCKLGCCYDSSEGICMENTPGKVCNQANGTWADDKQCSIPQCQLGCCVIGTQAAYVTLTRCKKLSAFYGLLTDFRINIGNELNCISLASLSDQGACVYGLDYINTCKFTSRQECNSIKSGMTTGNSTNSTSGGQVTGNVTFYKDYLCSNEELGTNCGPTKETICVEGKDEVYFKDSCGNIANIYDSGKINDKAYWGKIVSKQGSCGSGKANTNSGSCGNCDYFSGSICESYKTAKTSKPTYGNNICADLNCKSTSDGAKKHGESWCSTDKFPDSVGSRYFRHLCMNGEEIIEPCADFRQETCIQDDINGFSQAACRVNRWQDCLSQTEKKDCENTDKRDCKWISKKENITTITSEITNESKPKETACIPLHTPGLQFWDESAQSTCSLANVQCQVVFSVKCLLGQHEYCVQNCECMTSSWEKEQLNKCMALGDCGAQTNYLGSKGNKPGYKVTRVGVENETASAGGII